MANTIKGNYVTICNQLKFYNILSKQIKIILKATNEFRHHNITMYSIKMAVNLHLAVLLNFKCSKINFK